MATIASVPEGRPAGLAAVRDWRTAVAVFSAAVAALLAFAPQLFNDGDTYWHLAAGRLMIDTLHVPSTDPFSFTFRGQPWTAHEWLAEVLMAGAYRLGSWPAVASLHAAAVGLTLSLIGLRVGRTLPLRYAIVLLVLLAGVLAPFTLARPHVLAWPFLAAFVVVLLRARAEDSAPPLPAAAIMLVWANFHASFAVGLALAALFGLEALLQSEDRVRALRQWGVFGLALLVAALATPQGIEGLVYPLQVSSLAMLDTIAEWRATTWPRDWLFLVFAAGAGARRFLALAGARAGSPVHPRGPAGHGHAARPPSGAVRAGRRASGRAGAWPGTPAAGERGGARRPCRALRRALALAAVRQLVPLAPPDTRNTPGAAIAAVPRSLVGQPVLNSYGFGGALISRLRAVHRRQGRHVRRRVPARAPADEGGDMALFRRIARRRALAWTIIAPGEPLVAKLDSEPGWRRIYADERAVIHVRTAGE